LGDDLSVDFDTALFDQLVDLSARAEPCGRQDFVIRWRTGFLSAESFWGLPEGD